MTPFHAHNEWLHLLATQGSLGGLMGLLLVVMTVRSLRSSPNATLIGTSIGLLALMLTTGFLVVPLLLLLAILLGLLDSRQNQLESSGTIEVSQLVRIPLFVALALCTGAGLFRMVQEAECSARCHLAFALPAEDRDEAHSLLTQCCLSNPDRAVYWNLKASFLSQALPQLSPRARGEWLLEAREAMRRVTELEPHNGDAWASWARLLSMGTENKPPDIVLAKAAYLRAVQLEPNLPRLRVEFAARALEWNELGLAHEQIDLAREVNPGEGKFSSLKAMILWKEGKHLPALLLSEAALSEHWNDPVAFRDCFIRCGVMALELKLHEHCALLAEELIQMWPDHPTGYRLRDAVKATFQR